MVSLEKTKLPIKPINLRTHLQIMAGVLKKAFVQCVVEMEVRMGSAINVKDQDGHNYPVSRAQDVPDSHKEVDRIVRVEGRIDNLDGVIQASVMCISRTLQDSLRRPLKSLVWLRCLCRQFTLAFRPDHFQESL